MSENKIEVYDYNLLKDIKALKAQKLSLSEIAFSLNLNYLELKQFLTDLAIDEKATEGNSTSIQIQMKRDDQKEFQNIKSDVWDLRNQI